MFAGFTIISETVNVLEDSSVALECALEPGSNPIPVIEWVKCTTCDGSGDTVVIEDTGSNNIRFLNGERFLFLLTLWLLTEKLIHIGGLYKGMTRTKGLVLLLNLLMLNQYCWIVKLQIPDI